MATRKKRTIWTYLRDAAVDGPPPTPKEGETWYDPTAHTSLVYNGTGWQSFTLTADVSLGIAGYVAGGYNGGTSVQKMLFTNESITSLSSGLSLARSYPCGLRSDLKGYAAGGYTGSYSTRIDALVFQNDSMQSITNGLLVGLKSFPGAYGIELP